MIMIAIALLWSFLFFFCLTNPKKKKKIIVDDFSKRIKNFQVTPR